MLTMTKGQCIGSKTISFNAGHIWFREPWFVYLMHHFLYWLFIWAIDLGYYETLSVTISPSWWRYSFFQIRISLRRSLFFLPKFFLDHNSVYLYWQMLCVETVEFFRTTIISARKKIIGGDPYSGWFYYTISCYWSLSIPPENRNLLVYWCF